MAKVTYTKAQLMDFTVKELKTLDLFSKIDSKGLNKTEIVKAMISAQKAEQKAIKAESEIKKEATPKTSESVKDSKEEVKEDVEEEANEEIEAPKSEKPIFHRPLKGRNPMTFR